MSLPLLAIGFLAIIVTAYFAYGRWVARQFELDDARVTPAHVKNDGVDYLPTRPFYLFAQHFSAIAAAGPIAGPILACLGFGWVPCLIWITFGVVLIGAVHDFSSLVASLRREGNSIAEITASILGPKAGKAMIAFIWLALIYVIVAFADVTAGTFVGTTEEAAAVGEGAAFNPGGAVAAAAIFYLVLSFAMGLWEKYVKAPLWLTTVIFVPAAFGVVWLGTSFSTLFIADAKTWGLIIMGYCAAASVLPLWALLQPRGYLGGFILFAALALGIIGVFSGQFEIAQPAFKGFLPLTPDGTPSLIRGTSATNTLFPFLFVTIACGACSGFHGLVCTGTTSKQIDRETHTCPIGYGAMLAEGFVAFIALVTVMILTKEQLNPATSSLIVNGIPNPGRIYGHGIGNFLALLVGQEHLRFAITFGAMAFSTFVFDTLDVCTRLGRYLVQELTGWKGPVGAIGATMLTVVPAVFFLMTSPPGGYLKFWTLFGASNQLLAALTLLAITVWLYQARKRIAFTLIPMVFVLTITLWALTKLTIGSLVPVAGQALDTIGILNGVASLILIGLALFLCVTALGRLRGERRGSLTFEPAPTGTVPEAIG